MAGNTLAIPLLAGRRFTGRETAILNEASRPVLLSRSLATDLFGTLERAVGRSLEAAVFGQPMPSHVVGVVEDIIDTGRTMKVRPHVLKFVYENVSS